MEPTIVQMTIDFVAAAGPNNPVVLTGDFLSPMLALLFALVAVGAAALAIVSKRHLANEAQGVMGSFAQGSAAFARPSLALIAALALAIALASALFGAQVAGASYGDNGYTI